MYWFILKGSDNVRHERQNHVHAQQPKLKLVHVITGKQVVDSCASLAAITVMCKGLCDKLFGSFPQLCLLQSNRAEFMACHLYCLLTDLFNRFIVLHMDSTVLFRKLSGLKLDLHMFKSVSTKSYSDSVNFQGARSPCLCHNVCGTDCKPLICSRLDAVWSSQV